jgi:putative flippase GtrA
MTPPRRLALHSGLWFLAVGGTAALTHFVVFTLTRRALWPEVANAVGFMVAFWVSFWGHRYLSFGDAGTTFGQSLRRFAVTALAGFAGNALFFSACYRVLHWPPSLAWLAATALATGQTFLLSRFWAFRR